jgi:DNA-binding FrmR family transcriptional regulator
MVDQKIKGRALHRAKIIKGQMEGLIKGIDSEEYCTELLRLSLSIQHSLKSLDALLLENHLKTHVRHQMVQKGQDQKAIKELVDVYTLSNK